MSDQREKLDEILQRNPQVDPAEVRKAMDLQSEVRKLGGTMRTYQIATPSERQRAQPETRQRLDYLSRAEGSGTPLNDSKTETSFRARLD